MTETILARFKKLQMENKNVGHYILLSKAIRGMKYGKTKVSDAFNKLVPKSDYASDERDSLLENLWRVTEGEKSPYF